MTRKQKVQAHVDTWSNGKLRKFVTDVYAAAYPPAVVDANRIYTWSTKQLKQLVTKIFLEAHKTGPFPWEKF